MVFFVPVFSNSTRQYHQVKNLMFIELWSDFLP